MRQERSGRGRWTVAAALTLPLVASPAASDDEGALDDLLNGRPGESSSAPAAPPTDSAGKAEEPEGPPRETATAGTRKRRVVEEIIVTAQKTEQNIREVPISMSVLDGEFIQQESITDFRDLSLYVPNAKLDNNGTLPYYNIRGFSAHPLNRAFEQAIGIVLDGVAYGTSPYFQLPLFDVQRVEVLRGPQGALFGKNATAGVFNITNRQPTDDLEGFVDVQLGELDRRRFESGVGGPVIPGVLNVRISGLLEERDGVLRNTTAEVVPEANDRSGGRDRKALRGKLTAPDVLGTRIRLGFEHTEVDLVGAGSELGIVSEQLLPFYRSYDPSFDSVSGNFVTSVDLDEFTRLRGNTFTADLRRELAGWGIDLVAGYSTLDFETVADADLGPAPILILSLGDTNIQTSVELRTTSPSLPGLLGLGKILGLPLGSTNLTAGIFWQDRDIEDSELGLEVGTAAAAQFLAFQNAPSPVVAPIGDFIGTNVPLGDLGRFDTTANEIATVFFEERSNAIAGFGQMDWHFLARWTLQYGMRVSHDSKEADWNSVTEQGTGLILRAALGREEFVQSLERAETNFSPKVMLKYDWTDDINFYAGWIRGFRAGGFNEFASTADPEELAYDDEKVVSWEGGSKLDLLGGAARVNLGVFWMELEEFQVLTQDPDEVTFRVDNAGEARSRGVEVDATWLPTSWATVFGTLGLQDTEFLVFPFGTCTADNEDADGDGDPRCDLAGEPLDFTPKWMATLAGNVRFPLASIGRRLRLPDFLDALELVGSLSGEYQDTHFVDSATRDPRVRQGAFFRFNGGLGVDHPGQGWSLRVVAQNLTDEFTTVIKSDVPLAGGTFYQAVEPPRLVFGQFRFTF